MPAVLDAAPVVPVVVEPHPLPEQVPGVREAEEAGLEGPTEWIPGLLGLQICKFLCSFQVFEKKSSKKNQAAAPANPQQVIFMHFSQSGVPGFRNAHLKKKFKKR